MAKKPEACLNLELTVGEEFSSDEGYLTNILYRNCADRNEMIVKKLHEVRQSFKSTSKAIAAEKGGITSVKRLARTDCDSGEDVRGNKRVLFVATCQRHVGMWNGWNSTASHVSLRLIPCD